MAIHKYMAINKQELQSRAQWKAVSHPLRLGILRLLAERGEQTNEELARSLGEASGKLYFHTKKLLDADLIELAGTRQKGPLTEKLYRATAKRLTVPTIANDSTPPLADLLSAALDLYRNTWTQTDGMPNETHLGFHLVLPQSRERIAAFAERLRELVKEFQSTDAESADGETTSFSALLHTVPTSSFKSNESKEE